MSLSAAGDLGRRNVRGRRAEAGPSTFGSTGRGSRLRRWLPMLAGVALVSATLALGSWQSDRARQKLELQQRAGRLAAEAPLDVRADARPAEGQPLKLEGRWLTRHTILLDNRTQGGRVGYHVLTPLLLADGSGSVLVNRGWVAAPADRRELPAVPTAEGLLVLEGRMRGVEERPFSLSREVADGPRWQYLDLAHFRVVAGADLGPQLAAWTLQQTSAADDGLVRDWPAPGAGIDRHRAYALQWYSLAGLAAALTVWYAGRLFTRR